MKKILSVLLTAALVLGTCSCSSTAPAEESTETSPSAEVSESSETTTSSETTPSETEASYCDSGLLKGMRIEKNNFFANGNAKYQELIGYAQHRIDDNSFSGAVLLATEDEIIFFAGPDAKTVTGDPVDPCTTYDIGSCSKVFTAAAVFQLIEKGKISLDDKLNKYFPDYKTGKKITIYNLLHMQSGIADFCNDPKSFWVNVEEKDFDDFWVKVNRDEVSDEEFLENLYAAKLVNEPGKKFEYCNTNYVLLAMIVEKVSGMRFCDYLKENIFDVCGMEYTTSMVAGNETSVPELFEEEYKAGFVSEKGYYMAPNGERGCGGIHTSMADLWAFDKALLGGRIVSEDSLKEMMNYDMDYGCGLMPYEKNSFGHSGANGTYRTQNIIIESKEYGRLYFMASTGSITSYSGLGSLTQLAVGIE